MNNGTLDEPAIFNYIMSKAPPGDEDWQYILEDILDTASPIDFCTTPNYLETTKLKLNPWSLRDSTNVQGWSSMSRC